MLFRAIFWIGVVALLMPRESVHDAHSVPGPAAHCGSCELAWADFQAALLNRLATVKDDIEVAERARGRPD